MEEIFYREIRNFEIIDFHTHPFMTDEQNICSHAQFAHMSSENTVIQMKQAGISKICGSVISPYRKDIGTWDTMRLNNETALQLKSMYQDFYVPGIHIHPSFVRESCDEIEKMSKAGVKMIGELVPYCYGWQDYDSKEMDEILDVAEQFHMIVNIHTMNESSMDGMVKKHPNLVIVAAHPGEYQSFQGHMERMEISKNYYLDLSGTGIFRHGMLRHGLDLFGAERFLFGTDFPTCNPAVFIGGVLFDNLITDDEKEYIFSRNAKRLLGINEK